MFKCLTLDNRSWYDHMCHWKPNQWMPHIEDETGPGHDCGTGYHLGRSIIDALAYGHMPCKIWTARGKVRYGYGCDKVRYGSAKIIDDVTPDLVKIGNTIVAQLESMPKKRGVPLKSWVVNDTIDQVFLKSSYANVDDLVSSGQYYLDINNINKLPMRLIEETTYHLDGRVVSILEGMNRGLRRHRYKSTAINIISTAVSYIYIVRALVCNNSHVADCHKRMAGRLWNCIMRGYIPVKYNNEILYVARRN